MITPGEVRAVRELSRGVQAQVCLGADVKHGSAIITVETTHPEVMEALETLKSAIRRTTKTLVGDVLEGQAVWDRERGVA